MYGTWGLFVHVFPSYFQVTFNGVCSTTLGTRRVELSDAVTASVIRVPFARGLLIVLWCFVVRYM